MRATSVFIILAIPLFSWAKLFQNSYVQFELPDQWSCKLEGTEYTCSSQNTIDAKESIIVMAAKEVGPQDSFQEYERFLKVPRQIKGKTGLPITSVSKYVKNRQILGHPWVDGMHLNSEIEGYYTRYAGTIKEKLAILVTFSAHQTFYTKYSKDFVRAVETLRVTATGSGSVPSMGKGMGSGGTGAGQQLGYENTPAIAPSFDDIQTPQDRGPNKKPLMGIALLFILAAAYLILKK